MRFCISILILMIISTIAFTEEVKLSQEQAHQFFAVELNNKVWGLLEKTDRTEAENNEMIWAAYSSLYHWSVIGQPVNIQRGEWLVSRVWAVLGNAESAMYHAERCRKLTIELDLEGFDLGYSFEALARASACAGDKERAIENYKMAKEVGDKIEDPEDAKIFFGDLDSEPWFGVR